MSLPALFISLAQRRSEGLPCNVRPTIFVKSIASLQRSNCKSDPRSAFTSALCVALGERESIVVYHQQFESQRLSELLRGCRSSLRCSQSGLSSGVRRIVLTRESVLPAL